MPLVLARVGERDDVGTALRMDEYLHVRDRFLHLEDALRCDLMVDVTVAVPRDHVLVGLALHVAAQMLVRNE
jgi:hypothetical protein